MPDERDLERISPPFDDDDREKIRQALDEAQINPDEHFEVPRMPSQREPEVNENPDVPEGRPYETYNGQRGDGSFYREGFNWQPGCAEQFTIVISEVWNGPPPTFAMRFKQWAAFATLRAVLVCKKNKKCRRPIPLGCQATREVVRPDGTILGMGRFVFECAEL